MPNRPIEELAATVGESRETVVGLAVEAGKVEEFARAVRADDPVHRDESVARDRGYGSIPAPLTFTRTAYFERYRPDGVDERLGFDLGLDPRYLVHGEQAYEFERPVVVGDVLSGTTTLADVYRREGSRGGPLTFVVFETAFRDEAGDLVLTEYNTRIETGAAIDDGDAPDGETSSEEESTSDGNSADDGTSAAHGSRPPSDRAGRRTADGNRPTPDAADVSVGDRGPTAVVEDVDREDFVRYAGASGDFHRVHYDEPYATAAGNPTVFGQGMLTAGVASGVVADWLGLANVRRFRTRFETRLWPGTTVTVGGEVTDRRVEDGEVFVDVAFSATTGDGEVLLTGEATAALPGE